MKKKKRKKRKEKKEKDRKESARLGLEPSDFGGVGFSVAPGTQSDFCLEFDIDCCSLTPLHFTPQYFFYRNTLQLYNSTHIQS